MALVVVGVIGQVLMIIWFHVWQDDVRDLMGVPRLRFLDHPLTAVLSIVALFAFIVLRGFSRMSQEGSLFVLLAATGLLVQFGLQAAINMASTLHLIPTKGMTLPFLSYGGSSMLALGLGMGMLLALTRRRHHGDLQ